MTSILYQTVFSIILLITQKNGEKLEYYDN